VNFTKKKLTTAILCFNKKRRETLKFTFRRQSQTRKSVDYAIRHKQIFNNALFKNGPAKAEPLDVCKFPQNLPPNNSDSSEWQKSGGNLCVNILSATYGWPTDSQTTQSMWTWRAWVDCSAAGQSCACGVGNSFPSAEQNPRSCCHLERWTIRCRSATPSLRSVCHRTPQSLRCCPSLCWIRSLQGWYRHLPLTTNKTQPPNLSRIANENYASEFLHF